MLVYLQAPDAAAKTVALLGQAPTQEEQIDYARDLRAAQGRLDARAAQGVLLVVRQGRHASRAATASPAS